MKQKISLGGSISVLIGAVIAILALLRGPVQTVLLLATFILWGLWVLLTLLRPAWRDNRAYRRQEELEAERRDYLSNRNVAQLLLCHVNYRVSDHLKKAYPNARWEWMMKDPILFIAQGGTVRIRLYGVPDYAYADVTLDQRGGLNCSLVKVVPMQDSGQQTQTGDQADPSAWYELEGQAILDSLVNDLSSRGHSSLTLNEDGSISIQPEDGGERTLRRRFSDFPKKAGWRKLAQVLEQDGLRADVWDSGIVVSW